MRLLFTIISTWLALIVFRLLHVNMMTKNEQGRDTCFFLLREKKNNPQMTAAMIYRVIADSFSDDRHLKQR